MSNIIQYDIRSNLSPGKRLLLPSVINIYELRLLYEMARLKLYSSGANPIIYICFTLMGKSLISLLHDGYVLVSKEECILGNM